MVDKIYVKSLLAIAKRLTKTSFILLHQQNKLIYFLFLLWQVFKLNKLYKGQYLINDVTTNIAAKINKTIPKIPVIIPLKNTITIRIATNNLTILSAPPMFGFIVIKFID